MYMPSFKFRRRHIHKYSPHLPSTVLIETVEHVRELSLNDLHELKPEIVIKCCELYLHMH